MRRGRVWKLLVMGAISGVVGWLVRCLPAFLSLPAAHTASPWQWFLCILMPCIVGAGIAILFPIWQRHLRIRNFLVQCIVFWAIVPILLLVVYSLAVFGHSVISGLRLSIVVLFLPVGAVVAGACFYGMGRLLDYRPKTPAPGL